MIRQSVAKAHQKDPERPGNPCITNRCRPYGNGLLRSAMATKKETPAPEAVPCRPPTIPNAGGEGPPPSYGAQDRR